MKRTLLFVPLLLAASVVLAGDAPEPGPAAGTTQQAPRPDKDTAAEGPGPDRSVTGEKPEPDTGPKLVPGMSILGNQEAPKSLVLVPWKSSELGASVGISTMLDDSRQPIDREVFMRALSYYEISTGKKP